jgi:hypothetical protein
LESQIILKSGSSKTKESKYDRQNRDVGILNDLFYHKCHQTNT